MVKNLPAMQKTRAWSLDGEGPLNKRMAIHSSILTWGIPGTEKSGRLQSMGRKESDTTEQLTHTHTDTNICTECGQMRVISCEFVVFYDPLYFYIVCCSFFIFISNFIDLSLHFFLQSLAKDLSILFTFSKNELLALFIFAIVSFISFSFIYALVFMFLSY